MTPAKAAQAPAIDAGPMCSSSMTAASSIAISGAMKVSAIACASGTRPMPQKNNAAMIVTTTPRSTCTRIVLRSGQELRRGRYRIALTDKFAAERHTLTATMPMTSTRCFITASMIDSTATAPSAARKPRTGCCATRFTRGA